LIREAWAAERHQQCAVAQSKIKRLAKFVGNIKDATPEQKPIWDQIFLLMDEDQKCMLYQRMKNQPPHGPDFFSMENMLKRTGPPPATR
jgi:hypothetical protein